MAVGSVLWSRKCWWVEMGAPVLIALVVIAFFGLLGFKDGVIKRVLEIAGVFVSLILTARFATAVQPWVEDKTGLAEGAALLVTWAALFFAGLLLSRFLATMISKMVRLTILGWLDRWGGAVVGMALGTLVASVLLVAVSSVPGGVKVQNQVHLIRFTPVKKVVYHGKPFVKPGVLSCNGFLFYGKRE